MNFANFLRTPFLQNTSGRLLFDSINGQAVRKKSRNKTCGGDTS